MPRFHFHVLDGAALTDTTGAELPDINAAKVEAIKFAGGVLLDGIDVSIWQGNPWHIVVNDSPAPENGRTYFTLTLTATEYDTRSPRHGS